MTYISYADDTIIIAKTEEELKFMIVRRNVLFKIYGKELNAKKTKVMEIEKAPGKRIQINSENIVLEKSKKLL